MKEKKIWINRFYLLIIVLVLSTNLHAAVDNDSLASVAMNLVFQGNDFIENNDYESAERIYNKAVSVWKEVTVYNEYSAYPHFQLASLYRQLGNYEKSIEQFSFAEDILIDASTEYKFLLGGLYNRMGTFFSYYGDQEKSLQYFTEALSILEPVKHDNASLYSQAAFGIAQSFYFKRNYVRSIEISYDYLKENEGKQFRKLIGNSFVNLGEYRKAIQEMLVLSIEYEENSFNLAETYLILAKAYFESNSFIKAKHYFTESHEILQKITSENDPWIIYYYELYGQYLRKRASFEEGDSKLNLLKEAVSVLDKALLLNSNTKDKIIPYLDGEGDFITPTQVKDVFVNRINVIVEIGKVYKKQDDHFSALNYYDQALNTADATIRFLHDFRISFLEEESRLNLSEQYDDVYIKAFEIAAMLFNETGLNRYYEKMLEFAESGKSSTLLAALNDVQAKNFGGIPDSLINVESEINKKLANLKQVLYNEQNAPNPDSALVAQLTNQIFRLEDRHDEMIFLFEREYPDYYNFKYKRSSISSEQIAENLNKHELLIEYYLDEPTNEQDSGKIYVLAISNAEKYFVEKTISYQFTEDIELLYNQLTNRSVGETNKQDFCGYVGAANRLYSLLFPDFIAALPRDELIVIPHGKLAYLPFDALITEAADTSRINYRDLKYLVYKYNVTYAYSATLHFDYFKSSKNSGNRILALAPDYGFGEFDLNKAAYDSRMRQVERATLRPLPGAKEEVMGLSEMNNCEALIGEEATESFFKEEAGNYDILHLAMHTIMNDSIPMYSKLVFSGRNDSLNDGFLNTQEIYNMKLGARLAVLSACNTGSGVMRTGEGVMSMSRAFLYAGCPAIIMTLWEVEDKVSADLMLRFYKYLFKGVSKPEALRRAKLDHIKNADPLKAHPYFWLGYIFVGDPSPIILNSSVVLFIICFGAVLLFLLIYSKKHIKMVFRNRFKKNPGR